MLPSCRGASAAAGRDGDPISQRALPCLQLQTVPCRPCPRAWLKLQLAGSAPLARRRPPCSRLRCEGLVRAASRAEPGRFCRGIYSQQSVWL